MYFALSKLLLFLLYPAFWVFIVFVIALFVKDRKRKQRWLIAAVALLYIFSAPLFLNLFARAWSIKPTLAKVPNVYSCAIILGGYTSVHQNGDGYFNSASDRFIEAVRLFNTGVVKNLLLSGGNGSLMPGEYKEANWAKTQLLTFKVPDSSILIESNSRNTIENAIFSKQILQKSGLKPPYLLVTSDFHMRRAFMIFKKEGLQVIPYPCDYSVGQWMDLFSDLIPDGVAWAEWNIYLKELVGYVVDKWK
ncbi:YdcF family protein [Mucilaginibacter sp. L196]|uniref:YdcF family protein n=1 Tax=Mucilaginibacter sp. L196 TaxID=1641870 RepID=UPI00131E6B81|nr:YdcF family protein [Mucilaginibacter sp. L196]